MGSKHWKRLWENDLLRKSLLDLAEKEESEAEKRQFEQTKSVLDGLSELYTLMDFYFTLDLNKKYMGNYQLISLAEEINKAKNHRPMTKQEGAEKLRIIAENMARIRAENAAMATAHE